MRFDRVIILGNGAIASTCINLLIKNDVYPIVIESQYSSISLLKRVSETNMLEYYADNNRDDVYELITKLADECGKTLLISANNEFIIPKKLCTRKDMLIINFHYSYLPDYRGMNIPTWVIYNGEEYTGVSWHYVNADIDDGDIIAQAKIGLSETTTALDVVKSVMRLGGKLFDDFISKLLCEEIEGKTNINPKHIYKRKQLPKDGVLQIGSCSNEEISRLLRSYDYRPMQYIPLLKIDIEGNLFEIKKYRIIKNGEIIVGNAGWKENYCFERSEYRFELFIE